MGFPLRFWPALYRENPNSVRTPQSAPQPNTTTKDRFTKCPVAVPLLQPWSTATSHMKKNTIASTAILFNSIADSSEQLRSLLMLTLCAVKAQ
jgi:hypothetical protein